MKQVSTPAEAARRARFDPDECRSRAAIALGWSYQRGHDADDWWTTSALYSIAAEGLEGEW